MTDFKDAQSMIEYPKEGILSKVLFREREMDITMFCMAKGTKMTDHTSTKEGIVYVIEGRGTFVLKGDDIEMSPGKVIYLERDAVHSLEAAEDTSFILALHD